MVTSRCTYPYLAQILLSPQNGVNDFAFVVGTRVEKETNQLSLILLFNSCNGMVTSTKYLAAPIPISPKLHTK